MLHVKNESKNVIQTLQNSLRPHTHLIVKIFLDSNKAGDSYKAVLTQFCEWKKPSNV